MPVIPYKYLIVGGFFAVIIYVILFGGDPKQGKYSAEKAERSLEWTGKDPLVEDIKKQFGPSEDSQDEKKSSPFFGLGGQDEDSATATETTGAAPYQYPDYMMKERPTNPLTGGTPYPQPDVQSGIVEPPPQAAAPAPPLPQASEPPPPPQNTYYPPPPPGQTAPQTDVVPYVPGKGSRHTLPNGKPIAFMGTRVFTVDSKNHMVPVPDGTYPMYEGRGSLVVKNGVKIIVSN